MPPGSCSADCPDSPDAVDIGEAPADLEDQCVRMLHKLAAYPDEVGEHGAQSHSLRNRIPLRRDKPRIPDETQAVKCDCGQPAVA